VAEVIKSLAGRTLLMHELVTGHRATEEEPPHSVTNPRGLTGIDKSGPPWGSCWRHPLATFGGSVDSPTLYAGFRPLLTLQSASASSTLSQSSFDFRVYVRPHDGRLGAPYSRGYPLLRFVNTVSASPSIAVVCAIGGDARATTVTTSPTLAIQERAPNTYWDLVSGWNSLRLTLAVSPGITTPIHLLGLSINNIAKRSHL
jgi:hypothetical protein